jgi:ComF family protein
MWHWVDSGMDRIGALLLPPRCVLCEARGQPPCLDLCAGCESSLLLADEPARILDQRGLRRSFAPFAYASPLDHLVHALKYRGQLATARVLGTLLAGHVARHGLHQGIDVVVPVPLHPVRHAERGFNQSAEIARHLGRCLRLPVDESLATRQRATPPQVGLHLRQRRRNLRHAFAADPAPGRRVALVDDVTTTGTTLQELASRLMQAGATAVDGWCVARADRHGIRSGTSFEPWPPVGRMR